MGDIYDIRVLNRTVKQLKKPDSFLLDMFFPMIEATGEKEINFDTDESRPRIAPFVSPLVAGKVVQDLGYSTQSFKPAYVKDKRVHDSQKAVKRMLGESFDGDMTPDQRAVANLKISMIDQLEMLDRREQVMASQALHGGKVIVSGDGYPTTEVDFKRNSQLTEVLTGAARWGEAGVDPLEDLEDRVALIQSISGAAATTVVLSPGASKLLRKSTNLTELLDNRRGGDNNVNLGPVALPEEKKHIYLGRVGALELWQYDDVYEDEEGVEQHMMPTNSVIIGSRSRTEGVRHYGMIHDEKANFKSPRHFVKSWAQDDPSVRFLLMQSAPLIVPYRPDATMSLTVR